MLGVETLVDLRNELSGPQSVIAIKIKEMKLYTDNMACLCWIQQYVKLEKMNKKFVFIQNRLKKHDRLCENNPSVFSFIDGINNPSDLVTRSVSYRQLKDSNYLTEPDFLISKEVQLCRANILCADIITNFLDDQTIISYFESNNMQRLSFEQYYKGCNKLGSLVESCVKLTKRLLSAPIKKKNVLDFHDF